MSWCPRRTTPKCEAYLITNNGSRIREIEVTSYAELVLARQAADSRIRPFQNSLSRPNFWGMSARSSPHAAGATPGEPEVWAAQISVVDGETVGKPQYRNRPGALHRARPRAQDADRHDRRPKLSNTVGAVLDPIFALRRRVRIAPGATVASPSGRWRLLARKLLDLIDKHRDVTALSARHALAGRRRRCSCIISASPPAKPACSSVWPVT